MSFLETRVRVQHMCPYCDLSAVFPDVEMDLWTNTQSDVFHITATTPQQLQKLLRMMQESLGARTIIQDGPSALVVTHQAAWDYPPSIPKIADRRGLWVMPPTIYFGGSETYRVISPTIAVLRRFVADIKKFGKVEMLSHRARDQMDRIRSLGTIPVHLFEGLTDRQIHIMVNALEGGLFELPATEKMDRVAAREGLSRSTFGEHLRKAEAQILRNSYPFLKLKDQTAKSGSGSPLRRTQGAEGESPVGIASGPNRY